MSVLSPAVLRRRIVFDVGSAASEVGQSAISISPHRSRLVLLYVRGAVASRSGAPSATPSRAAVRRAALRRVRRRAAAALCRARGRPVARRAAARRHCPGAARSARRSAARAGAARREWARRRRRRRPLGCGWRLVRAKYRSLARAARRLRPSGARRMARARRRMSGRGMVRGVPAAALHGARSSGSSGSSAASRESCHGTARDVSASSTSPLATMKMRPWTSACDPAALHGRGCMEPAVWRTEVL